MLMLMKSCSLTVMKESKVRVKFLDHADIQYDSNATSVSDLKPEVRLFWRRNLWITQAPESYFESWPKLNILTIWKWTKRHLDKWSWISRRFSVLVHFQNFRLWRFDLDSKLDFGSKVISLWKISHFRFEVGNGSCVSWEWILFTWYVQLAMKTHKKPLLVKSTSHMNIAVRWKWYYLLNKRNIVKWRKRLFVDLIIIVCF